MKRAWLFLSLIFLSGCATYYPVRINDYLSTTQARSPFLPGATFFVMENRNDVNPILEAENKSKIERMLIGLGYGIASYDQADLFLDFSYSMSPGMNTTEIRPIYNPGGTETIQTYRSSGRTSTSIVTLPGYTTYAPYRVTVYTSSLILNVLDAGELRNRNAKKIIWIGENSLTSENPDLRDTINYLLVAAFERFGQSTERSIITNISENDPRIKKLIR